MPKRATLTYSSEDANTLQDNQVFVYYCKYSGKHALTTGASRPSFSEDPPLPVAIAGSDKREAEDAPCWQNVPWV